MAIASVPSSFAIAAGKSGLFAPGPIASLSGTTESPDAVAAKLVAADELTQFQADKLLAGLWQGLRLGPYRVLAPIGRGGMGIVYLAAKGPTNAGPRFALKILPPRVARDEPRRLERFLREIRIGAALAPHPHVARTHEGGDVEGVHFLAMEFVPGPTLRKRVQGKGPLEPADAIRLAVGLADGLAHLHAAPVVHRDLKPANVILSPAGVKLLDFGFAIVPGEALPADPRVAGGPGYAIGTMDYIAPEQIRDASTVTAASDLYSLGCTLFYALTGTPPYPGGDVKQKLRWHRTSEPPDVRTIVPAVPAGLAELVTQLLEKEPGERPDSAGEVRERLRAFGEPDVAVVPDAVGIDTAVEMLTHQKVAAEELLEPIILDDEDWIRPRNSPPVAYWYFIAALMALIVIFAMTMAYLIATQRN